MCTVFIYYKNKKKTSFYFFMIRFAFLFLTIKMTMYAKVVRKAPIYYIRYAERRISEGPAFGS